ncbi:MAG: HAMP domain-containing protein, partial [Gemmatimonadetes bacterium]|nr:HAMP domain-containing protein [Gemmatimonadota bacterium]
MNLRSHIVLASFFVVLVPLAIIGTVLDRNEEARGRAERTEQAERTFDAFRSNWERERTAVERKLVAIEESVRNDGEMRAAVLSGQTQSERLLDAAGLYARLAGFDVLYLLDDTGIVLSSGHFRNEFGTKRARFTGVAGRAFESGAATEIGFADRRERVWIVSRPLSLSGRNLVLAGGITLDDALFARLRPGPDTRVTLDAATLSDTNRSAQAFTRAFPVPFVGEDGARAEQSFLVSWNGSGFETARTAARRNLLLTLGATGAGLLLLSFWFASRISAPIRSLATRAASFDLDRPAVSFRMNRSDEVGRLAGLLEEMKERIVRNAGAIRAAERRAAIGDLARQVNHDLKNGLAPLRNIFRHLSGMA